MPCRQPKVLFLDIETSKMLTLTFSRYPEYIAPEDVVEDWRIHCASWKWLGKPKVYSVVEIDKDDRNVCQALIDVINEADYLVYHNGDKFDLKKIKARVARHDLDAIAPVATIDTLKEIKKVLTDSSHRLDDLGNYYGVGRKIENAKGLWRRTFFGEKKALAEMVKYNKQDVILLENVFLRVQKYLNKSINFNLFTKELDACPACNSVDRQARGVIVNATTTRQRYQCTDCGKWYSSTKTLNKSEVK